MFKEILKATREKAGLTQAQLAEKCGISQPSVAQYELGSRTPEINVLSLLANALNCTTDYLLGRE